MKIRVSFFIFRFQKKERPFKSIICRNLMKDLWVQALSQAILEYDIFFIELSNVGFHSLTADKE